MIFAVFDLSLLTLCLNYSLKMFIFAVLLPDLSSLSFCTVYMGKINIMVTASTVDDFIPYFPCLCAEMTMWFLTYCVKKTQTDKHMNAAENRTVGVGNYLLTYMLSYSCRAMLEPHSVSCMLT